MGCDEVDKVNKRRRGGRSKRESIDEVVLFHDQSGPVTESGFSRFSGQITYLNSMWELFHIRLGRDFDVIIDAYQLCHIQEADRCSVERFVS
jgi:hypothetical protein